MKHTGQIIATAKDLLLLQSRIPEVIAADVETYKTDPRQAEAKLLGISLSWEGVEGSIHSCYIPFWVFRNGQWKFELPEGRVSDVRNLLRGKKLIGWNAAYDRDWLNYSLALPTIVGEPEWSTEWLADGRIMWHLANKDESIRGFGLKLAQKKLLGWLESNDGPLKRNVEAKGGSLDKGDYYLADLPVLGHYAQLDTVSTLLGYNELKLFFDAHDYWHMADRILRYSFLIKESSDLGVLCDKAKLEIAHEHFLQEQQDATKALKEECAKEIAQIEANWANEDALEYKVASNADKFRSSPERWRRFNPASSQQRALLLHNVLSLPVSELTPTGKPKTDRSCIEMLDHPAAKHLSKHSEAKKLAEMTESFLSNWREGRIHPGYNICATVSGRLGGFKPYLLNAPFSEPRIMSAFSIEEGYIGVHADLTAIEPCLTAAYSEDPNLLKVYRDGKGDIYLDLALELFPDRLDLKKDYNPDGPPPSAQIKERYKDLRGVCKIIHLAVGYTGSFITVAKNLTKAGFPISQDEARLLVNRYWRKFARVKELSRKLQKVIKEKGYLHNVAGRIIHVDPRFIKDTLNRLIQSGGHDILVLWVFKITERLTELGIPWKPVILDIHDSTTIQVKQGYDEATKKVFTDTLEELNEELKLGVRIRCEVKTCRTLAGLKENE